VGTARDAGMERRRPRRRFLRPSVGGGDAAAPVTRSRASSMRCGRASPAMRDRPVGPVYHGATGRWLALDERLRAAGSMFDARLWRGGFSNRLSFAPHRGLRHKRWL